MNSPVLSFVLLMRAHEEGHDGERSCKSCVWCARWHVYPMGGE